MPTTYVSMALYAEVSHYQGCMAHQVHQGENDPQAKTGMNFVMLQFAWNQNSVTKYFVYNLVQLKCHWKWTLNVYQQIMLYLPGIIVAKYRQPN